MENCNLSSLPNEVGELISLETLDLGRNNLLITLPDGLCNLTRLKELYLTDCNVSHLPSEVGRLISLETLDLGGNNMRTLPDCICDLTCLKELKLNDCNVTHLPSEIGRLISLQTLDLARNNLLTLPDSICNLACLKELYLRHCNVSHLPGGIGMLSLLTHLDLESNNVCSLPNSFSDLASLEVLNLSNCGRLQSLPELPVTLRSMDASYCTLLESIPTAFNWQAGICMYLPGCNMLAKNNFANNAIERFGQYKEWSGLLDAGIYLCGDEVPNWIQHRFTGSKVSLAVPPRRILGWILCMVFKTHEIHGEFSSIKIDCNKTNSVIYMKELKYHHRDQMIIHFFPTAPFIGPNFYGEGELEIEISPYDPEKREPWLTVKKCGINLIYEDDGDNKETNGLLVHERVQLSHHQKSKNSAPPVLRRDETLVFARSPTTQHQQSKSSAPPFENSRTPLELSRFEKSPLDALSSSIRLT
ncbi:hypothetical protein Vadar_006394 [Vaccinium darrowii]|uniref:Uncharacterized protein n=1 Tax=Vaccinium darrowii TaxID=229202 RepID=A0ACB7XG04_9ERIC|nr:hypothetical protein Vadar_006394 [Vaccinium darrowii]